MHLVEEIMASVAPLLVQHIWQNQPFNLKYHPEKGTAASLRFRSCWSRVSAVLGLEEHDSCSVQEMFQPTLVEAHSLGTMWRMSGSSFTF